MDDSTGKGNNRIHGNDPHLGSGPVRPRTPKEKNGKTAERKERTSVREGKEGATMDRTSSTSESK